MALDVNAEILALRAVLRDLVALSAIPVAWVGREPLAVAAGLADTLIGLLHLEFVAVRLCDPRTAEAVEATRGDAWKSFPEWIETYLANAGRLSHTEIVPRVDGAELCRGVVMPVGLDADAGLVAAASDRADFPSVTDQLLLRLAANQAAAAFQNACLIEERRRAEEELRKARNDLEAKVAEQTTELRRSEAYLSEAQRLAHTGSYAVRVTTGQPAHISDEHIRLYGFDPEQGVPTLEQLAQRVHPEDRGKLIRTFGQAVREAASWELEYRVVHPQGQLKFLHGIGHPVFKASGEFEELVGSVVDVTERRRAEEQRQVQMWFLESLDGIDRAIQAATDFEQMMTDVLDAALMTFRCDRAWLVSPRDPQVKSHRVRMERTRPEYKGAFDLDLEIPNDPGLDDVSRSILASSSPVRFDPESDYALPPSLERFNVKSMMAVAVYPKVDKPSIFGLHQCSHPRVWTPQEERLFQEVGRRLADALDTQMILRNLRESDRRLERSRAELAASRVRIVTAADETRRRIERDLHDGVQQRLLSLALAQRTAQATVPPDLPELQAQLSGVADGLVGALEELREISRGIHPAALARGGLAAALKSLARQSAVPVELDVHAETRLPGPVEVAAYYVVSEALTNTAKHAQASFVHVSVEVGHGVLEVSIRDDGSGGANATQGSGLIGLSDRVDALGGTIEVVSPVGEGTSLLVKLPFAEVESP
jgi:signal transduction histidine kinase/PAS domain-containing protein